MSPNPVLTDKVLAILLLMVQGFGFRVYIFPNPIIAYQGPCLYRDLWEDSRVLKAPRTWTDNSIFSNVEALIIGIGPWGYILL